MVVVQRSIERCASGLLDDPSNPVRRALLLHFTQNSPAALGFLKEVAQGSNRVLAWHAKWFIDELKFTDPVAEFKGFIRSLNYELETGALLLSRTVAPNLDIGACCTAAGRHGCLLPRALHRAGHHPRKMPHHQPRALRRVRLPRQHRALRRSAQQLHRPGAPPRKGIPSSLSLIYLLVAQRLGLTLEPVALPGHFVVGCYLEDKPFFIDAFDKGVFRIDRGTLLRLSAQQTQCRQESSTSRLPCARAKCFAPPAATSSSTTPRSATASTRLFNEFVEEFRGHLRAARAALSAAHGFNIQNSPTSNVVGALNGGLITMCSPPLQYSIFQPPHPISGLTSMLNVGR